MRIRRCKSNIEKKEIKKEGTKFGGPFLEIEIATVPWGRVFHITKQKYRDREFNPLTVTASMEFKASNGFGLISFYHPEVTKESFYVRGSEREKDNLTFLIPNDYWLCDFKKAVKEYNKEMAKYENKKK